MISKTEWSGWWDQVCSRTGWSSKISKWKWMFLQIIIPIIIVWPFFAWMVINIDDYTLKQAVIFCVIFFPIVTLSNLGAWKRDQEKIREKQAEERVTL